MPMVISQAVFASPPETTDGFICPVLGGEAGGDHGKSSPDPIVPIGDDDSSVIGPDVTVPTHSTNQDGDGGPGPGVDRARPGDEDYSPIWATP